ncbi:VOC family protein [Microbacterium sp. NEAU-LLC]|uniref:VOC family protein n=1 Tax=Microbacterium helvum TaxID=2773713 RepID=A0ABR8NNV7_9MICO|nr:VOC family protein [Microbacterium helvum]MBD3942345.1 VOC family protein [Microbacterium helvum]
MSAHTAIPYLTVHDGAAALEFYQQAFGAAVRERYDDRNRIAHATLVIGGARLFVSDEFAELGALSPRTLGGSTVAVVLGVPDPDATYAAAVDAGAAPDRPVAVDGSGARSGWLTDPFGHRWNIRTASEASDTDGA